MIKPEMLKKGDKIAVVSLSWGALGDEQFIHKYYIAKERLDLPLPLIPYISPFVTILFFIMFVLNS